jgi:hypothetical protein
LLGISQPNFYSIRVNEGVGVCDGFWSMIMMVMVKKSFKVFVSEQWTKRKIKNKKLSKGGNGKKEKKKVCKW